MLYGTSPKKGEQIDLKLILKSLPARVDESNVDRLRLFDFKMI